MGSIPAASTIRHNMSEQNFYVYEHWRLDKDECFYVGKGTGRRAYERKERNSHWKNIVAKLERIGSAYEIRIVTSGLNEADAFVLEAKRIAFWQDKVDLCNKTKGGEGPAGYRHTAQAKKKIGDASRGDKNPAKKIENRKKISEAKLGHITTEEARKKMSAAKKGKAPWNKGKPGFKHNELTKLKMCKSQKIRRLKEQQEHINV